MDGENLIMEPLHCWALKSEKCSIHDIFMVDINFLNVYFFQSIFPDKKLRYSIITVSKCNESEIY